MPSPSRSFPVVLVRVRVSPLLVGVCLYVPVDSSITSYVSIFAVFATTKPFSVMYIIKHSRILVLKRLSRSMASALLLANFSVLSPLFLLLCLFTLLNCTAVNATPVAVPVQTCDQSCVTVNTGPCDDHSSGKSSHDICDLCHGPTVRGRDCCVVLCVAEFIVSSGCVVLCYRYAMTGCMTPRPRLRC